MSRMVHASIESDVTADEIAPEFESSAQHHERAGRRINDGVTRLRDGGDQSLDQSDRLHVWMGLAIDGLDPAVRNAAVRPSCARPDRRLLHHQQEVAAVARAMTLADAGIVRGDEIDDLENAGRNAEVVPLA